MSKTIGELYKHFSNRLFERYGIDDLTFAEYKELYNSPIRTIYRLSEYATFGEIEIGGQKVWVIKSTGNKALTTCLTYNSYYPVPIYARKLHMSRESFTNMLNEKVEKISEMRDYFISIGCDSKRFFTERHFDVPYWMYSAAYFMHNKDSRKLHYLHRTVKSLGFEARGIKKEKI